MRETILNKLSDTENDYKVKIIYACESGSRAWGFPSRDSDYDVRFLYVHPKDWYLSISEKRDVIELPVENMLDINGWDIRKSLLLLRKSNAPLFEWLGSPIIYGCVNSVMGIITELSKKAFLPVSAFHHYLAMAKNQMLTIQNSEGVKIKSYLYTLRPLLCCKWIVNYNSPPPTRFDDLLSQYYPEINIVIRECIELIIHNKKEHEESIMDRSDVLENYLITQLGELQSTRLKNPEKEPLEIYDDIFRKILDVST